MAGGSSFSFKISILLTFLCCSTSCKGGSTSAITAAVSAANVPSTPTPKPAPLPQTVASTPAPKPSETVVTDPAPKVPNDLNLKAPVFKPSYSVLDFGPIWHFYHPNTEIKFPDLNDDGYFIRTEMTGTKIGADINARMGWRWNTDCSKKIIAVLDSGIDRTHPDLASNIYINPGESGDGKEKNGIDDDGNGFIDDVYGWNFVGSSESPPTDNNDSRDDYDHGTLVSGVIGAVGNNGQGVPGVCWKAQILPVKVLDDEGSGMLSDIIEGISYAKLMGAQITNNSYGGMVDLSDSESLAMANLIKSAIDSAGAAGSLFVAAAGNGIKTKLKDGTTQYIGTNLDAYKDTLVPAGLNSNYILTVANTNAKDELSSTSNWGPTKVHVAAPGENISSLYYSEPSEPNFRDFYLAESGTSFSAPLVSGSAALFWSTQTSLTPLAVRKAILDYSEKLDSLTGKVSSGGRLNLGDLMSKKKGTRK